MKIVILTALGVGGATIIGSLFGFLFGKAPQKLTDAILYISYTLMLFAAIFGLILPAYEYRECVIGVTLSILFGVACLLLSDKLIPTTQESNSISNSEKIKIARVWLLILALGIHNFPEGVAAGVGFGSGDNEMALFIAGGIAMQNIPEGMIVIPPMLASGMSRKRAFIISLMTGGMEVLGTMVGYFAINISGAILPYILAFAGGTMLYVVSEETCERIRSKKI